MAPQCGIWTARTRDHKRWRLTGTSFTARSLLTQRTGNRRRGGQLPGRRVRISGRQSWRHRTSNRKRQLDSFWSLRTSLWVQSIFWEISANPVVNARFSIGYTEFYTFDMIRSFSSSNTMWRGMKILATSDARPLFLQHLCTHRKWQKLPSSGLFIVLSLEPDGSKLEKSNTWIIVSYSQCCCFEFSMLLSIFISTKSILILVSQNFAALRLKLQSPDLAAMEILMIHSILTAPLSCCLFEYEY